MTVSTAKTEVQCIPEKDSQMTLRMNGVALRQTKEFVYLGGKMSDSADSVGDVERRIGIATEVARSLSSLWKSRSIQTATKVRLYRALVQSVLLYNSETRTMTQALNHKLLVFEMTILGFIAVVTYFGHVVRMTPFRTANVLLYGRVEGRTPVGTPRKRWLDVAGEDWKLLCITLQEADQLARNRVL